MAAFMAALVDEVTSIIFITLFILKICDRLRVDPLPFVIAAVFTTNVGSSATVVGNPIGVMVALRGGFTFLDFIRWSTPNAVIVLTVSIIASLIVWRSYVAELDARFKRVGVRFELSQEILRMQWVNWILFIGTIGTLVVHHPLEGLLEELLGMESDSMKNVVLVAAPMFWASVGLLIERMRARDIVMHRVDWWTLLFFMLLFSTIGTLKYTGANMVIGGYAVELGSKIGGVGLGVELGTLLSVFILAGVLTAFLDNVLAIATLIPIVYAIYESLGWNVFPFFWGMSDPLPASLGGITPPPSGLSDLRSEAHTSPLSVPMLGASLISGPGGLGSGGTIGLPSHTGSSPPPTRSRSNLIFISPLLLRS
jgi:Na+/H+ antiporter NhaD/arsenite permease-like protein